jgi:polyhydroxyalkanoate synthesis regulator protein
LTRQQEQYRRRFAHAFGTAAFEAMQEQVRKNFATFEKALGLFTPFASSESGESGKANPTKTNERGETSSANAKPSEDEIANLKAELTAMQQRLEQLSRR